MFREKVQQFRENARRLEDRAEETAAEGARTTLLAAARRCRELADEFQHYEPHEPHDRPYRRQQGYLPPP